MSLTALRRTTAAVVAVAAGVGVAALPTFHADATAPAATSLSIRTAHAAVRPGGSDRVTGDLGVRGPATPAGRVVTLEARPTGTDSFTPVGTATARTHGGLTLKVMPAVTTRYRWHYAGDTDARPSVSGVATIRVRTPQHPPTRIRTSLSIRAVHRVVRPDGSDVVRGHLRAGRVALAHRHVLLVSHVAGADGWTFEGVHWTRHDGGVAFRVDPSEKTAYRLVFLGTPLLRPARSAVVRVLDRPDVSIAADPAQLTRGESTTISGVASDQGTPIAGATVKLLARKAGVPPREGARQRHHGGGRLGVVHRHPERSPRRTGSGWCTPPASAPRSATRPGSRCACRRRCRSAAARRPRTSWSAARCAGAGMSWPTAR